MIALDTNVLIRYFVQDDPVQCKQVNAMFLRSPEKGRSFFIADVVITEMVWVLESCYRYSRQQIHQLLTRLSIQERFVFAESTSIHSAIHFYGESTLDFADLLIMFQARSAGAKQLASFDEKLQKFDKGFVTAP